MKPFVHDRRLLLSSPPRIPEHLCGGERGSHGGDRAEAVYVGGHGEGSRRLCRLGGGKRHDGYPVLSWPPRLSLFLGDADQKLVGEGILPSRWSCTFGLFQSV